MIVVLVGVRGSGKTTVGRALALQTDRPFVDCDAHIEERTQLSIAEIFGKCGESGFRDLESQAIAELTKRDGIVLATGGGAVLHKKNVQLLRRCGQVVFLRIGAAEAYRRLMKDPNTPRTRPSLTDKDMIQEVREQVETRAPYYEGAAHFTVEVDGLDVKGVVRQITHYLAET